MLKVWAFWLTIKQTRCPFWYFLKGAAKLELLVIFLFVRKVFFVFSKIYHKKALGTYVINKFPIKTSDNTVNTVKVIRQSKLTLSHQYPSAFSINKLVSLVARGEIPEVATKVMEAGSIFAERAVRKKLSLIPNFIC